MMFRKSISLCGFPIRYSLGRARAVCGHLRFQGARRSMPLCHKVVRNPVNWARIDCRLPILAGSTLAADSVTPSSPLISASTPQPVRRASGKTETAPGPDPFEDLCERSSPYRSAPGSESAVPAEPRGSSSRARITRWRRDLPAIRSNGRDPGPAGPPAIPRFSKSAGRPTDPPQTRPETLPAGVGEKSVGMMRASQIEDAHRVASRGGRGRTGVGRTARGTPAPRQLATAVVEWPGASLTAIPAPGFSGSERHAGLAERAVRNVLGPGRSTLDCGAGEGAGLDRWNPADYASSRKILGSSSSFCSLVAMYYLPVPGNARAHAEVRGAIGVSHKRE